MGGERNTENVVRDVLRAKGDYGDLNILIEEQIFRSAKINRRLAHSSKSGNLQYVFVEVNSILNKSGWR